MNDKPTANIILNGEGLKVSPLRSGIPLRVNFYHSYSTYYWSPSQSNQARKRNKIGKEEVKLSWL